MLKERGGRVAGVREREKKRKKRLNQAISPSAPPDLEQEVCHEDDSAVFLFFFT